MEADIRWLDDPQVFRVGQLPAHSDHRSIRMRKKRQRAGVPGTVSGRDLGVRLFGEREKPAGGFLSGEYCKCRIRYDLCAGTY